MYNAAEQHRTDVAALRLCRGFSEGRRIPSMPQLGAVEDVDGPQPRTGNHGKQKYGFEYNTAEMVVANNVAFNNPWQSTAPKIIGKEKGAVAKLNFLPDSLSTK